MIATWMAYSVALGVLIGLAALSLERVAALWGRPRRLVCAAAVATSLLVPGERALSLTGGTAY